MANDEHVASLKQGVAAWNAWRDEDQDIVPDLSHAELNGAELTGRTSVRRTLPGRASWMRTSVGRTP